MAALFVCAAAVFLLLTPFPAGDWVRLAPRLFHDLENLCHPLVFALLGFVWLRHRTTHKVIALGTLVLLGALTELLQFATGRDPSWEDVAGDALGAGFAVAWHARSIAPVRMKVLIVALTAIVLAPLGWTLIAYTHRASEAPVLWRADSLLFRRFSSFGGGTYPGLVVDEPLRDWRGYRELQVDVDNPHPQTVHIKLRVHDGAHDQRYEDRYNEEFVLPAGKLTTLLVPTARIESATAGRRMDLADIGGIVIFQLAERGEPAPRVREIRLAR